MGAHKKTASWLPRRRWKAMDREIIRRRPSFQMCTVCTTHWLRCILVLSYLFFIPIADKINYFYLAGYTAIRLIEILNPCFISTVCTERTQYQYCILYKCIMYNCILYNCILYNFILYNCILYNCIPYSFTVVFFLTGNILAHVPHVKFPVKKEDDFRRNTVLDIF